MTTSSDTAIASMLPRERRAVGIIAVIAMLRMFGLFALLPVLSLYAGQLKGHTPLLVGLAVGAYGLTQAALQIPFGMLSDRIGRVPVIVGGLVIFAAGSAIAALGDSIWIVIVGRLLQGAGAISATLTALIADATRGEVRTRSMAVYGVGIGTSFIVAIVVGPIVAAHFGGASLFWLGALVAVVSAILLAGLPAAIERPVRAGHWDLRPAFRPRLLVLDFFVFLLHAIMTATFVALPFLLVHDLDLPTTSFWKVIAGAIPVSLLGTVPLIVRDDRQGKASTMAVAVGLLLAGELLLTFAGGSVKPVFFALVLYFAGFNFLEAALPARLSLLADEESRGACLGVFSSSQFLGAFAGGLLGGRFLAGGDPGHVFMVCAFIAGFWLLSGTLFPLRS